MAVLPAAGCAFDQDRITEPFHATVDKSPATLQVHNAVGAIEVDAWDKPSVEIDAEKRGTSLDDVHAISVSVQQQGSTLVITSHFPSGVSNCRVDYTIHAPASTNLDLDQSVGAIRSTGFTADFDASTSTGAVAATMAALGGTQSVKVHVGVGAIALEIPASSSAAITASTSIGAIKSDFPLTTQRNVVGENASGSIGKGDAHVDLSISTGAIAVRRE